MGNFVGSMHPSNNLEIVKAKVAHNPFNFSNYKVVPASYRSNKEVYTIAVKGYPSNIMHIPLSALEKDKEICYTALRLDRYVISDINFNLSFLSELYEVSSKNNSYEKSKDD